MQRKPILVFIGFSFLAGCSPRDEFPHQTVEAYQADKDLREDLLKKCEGHIKSKTPFRTQSDTEECRKAVTADANIRFAAHEERQRQGWSNLAGTNLQH